MTNLKTEKAPSLPADALSDIETALLVGSLDVDDEIRRRFPPGKPPAYRKSWARYLALGRKKRQFDLAIVRIDRLRRDLSGPGRESRLSAHSRFQ